jgi:outer membrane immunogenic protein
MDGHILMKQILLASAALLAFLGTSSASDLPAQTGIPGPVAAPWGANWSGFYVGAHLGLHRSDATFRLDSFLNFFQNVDNSTYLPSGDLDHNSAMGGAQAGVNYQMGRFVLGLEADVSVFGEANTTTFATRFFSPIDSSLVTTQVRSRMDYLGTARWRLGATFDHLLVYATAGLALGHVNYSVAYEEEAARGFPYIGAGQANTIHLGYVIGGGLEYAFTDRLSLKAEYLYYDLSNASLSTVLIGERGEAFTHTIDTGGHIGRVGVNFKL